MIAIGSDHAGFGLKQEILEYFEEEGLEYMDLGTYDTESCDYPIYGEKVARAVTGGQAKYGIAICGTGNGIAMTANKIKGIRCALCSDSYSAELARRHNDANMLAIGSRVTGDGLARMIVEAFLNTPFAGGRHIRRIGMIGALEERERNG